MKTDNSITELLKKTFWCGEYKLAPQTKSSYYAASLSGNFELEDKGEREKAMHEDIKKYVSMGLDWPLPYRIGCIRGGQMRSTSNSGRAAIPMVAQLKAAFTAPEQSCYKQHKPYEIQTGLWRVDGERTLYYGTLGITGENGKIDRDNGDLVILKTTDWNTLVLYVFKGLVSLDKKLEHLPQLVSFVKSHE